MTNYDRSLEGRNRNGGHRDAGGVRHAVRASDYPNFDRALCGARPGRTSGGWSADVASEATCRRCLEKIAKRGG